jgi:uncharacterized protein (DUF1015 family)
MARFLPFLAIMPRRDLAEQIVTLPFDGYSANQKEKILASNPFSFLHVILAQSQNNDARRQVLNTFLDQDVLQKTQNPVFLIYRQIQESTCFTGFIGVLPIGTDSDYQAIKQHEAILVQKEALLADYLDRTNLNAEPALLTFNASPESQELLNKLTIPVPDFDISLSDFGRHQLWIVKDPQNVAQIQGVFDGLPQLYIADGHHRISSSRRLANQRLQQHGNSMAADQYVLSACFPSNEAQILPYHRLVKKVPVDFLELLQTHIGHLAKMEYTPFAESNSENWMLRYKDNWIAIRFHTPFSDSILPADWLNDHILSPILNMHDLRNEKNIGFVGGRRNEADLIQEQMAACAEVLFVLPPVTFQQFFSIVNEGRLMPPKSTWFEPKLLSGFTMFDLLDQVVQ